uniref:hypothetical protein n=1 Tax=Okeania sp. SIO2F4 TaxID=2607790 RepID=UPI0025E20B52|nr:hypothetical protein [Okeania sp. SIO2F4]
MSQIYTKDFEVQCPPQQRTWRKIAQFLGNLPLPGIPIRLILTKVEKDTLTFESSFIDTDRKQVRKITIKNGIHDAFCRFPSSLLKNFP